MSDARVSLTSGLAVLCRTLHPLYRDLHRHPELSGRERRTAGIVANRLESYGWNVTRKVGGTGVVGLLANGPGPVVLLRADMDGLPIREDTGLAYASTRTTVDARGRTVPVMHACGHDVHTACLLGAAGQLAERCEAWSGTVAAVFQPAEENGTGARAMVDDGLLDLIPRPTVCLAQHVGPMPVGLFTTRAGPLMAAADTLRIRLFGRGGHGASPERTVDPILLASAVVSRLHTLISREIPAAETAVLSIGSLHAGTTANVVPDTAELELNLRSATPAVRDRLLTAIRRVVRAEALASDAPREPEFVPLDGFPLTVNDEVATSTVVDALRAAGHRVHLLPDILTASEDFGGYGAAAGCPSVFWHFGGDDTYTDAELESLPDNGIPARIPSNHSAAYAPSLAPAILFGTRALLVAAAAWIGSSDPEGDAS